MRINEQRDYYKALAENRANTLQSILDYCRSDKYALDNQCNVMDIILRINENAIAEVIEFPPID